MNTWVGVQCQGAGVGWGYLVVQQRASTFLSDKGKTSVPQPTLVCDGWRPPDVGRHQGGSTVDWLGTDPGEAGRDGGGHWGSLSNPPWTERLIHYALPSQLPGRSGTCVSVADERGHSPSSCCVQERTREAKCKGAPLSQASSGGPVCHLGQGWVPQGITAKATAHA